MYKMMHIKIYKRRYVFFSVGIKGMAARSGAVGNGKQ